MSIKRLYFQGKKKALCSPRANFLRVFLKYLSVFQYPFSPSEIKILTTLIEKLSGVLNETLFFKNIFSYFPQEILKCILKIIDNVEVDNAIYLKKRQQDRIKREPNEGHYY